MCHKAFTDYGIIGPFDLSIVFFIITLGNIFISCIVLIYMFWDENYGTISSLSYKTQITSSFNLLYRNKSIFIIGVVQSCFESSIFIFVFFWTPVLTESISIGEDSPKQISHGLIFCCFMISLMCGSIFCKYLFPINRIHKRFYLLSFFSMTSFAIIYVVPMYSVQLVVMCFYEFIVGLFRPVNVNNNIIKGNNKI